jgi:hypothetical protein
MAEPWRLRVSDEQRERVAQEIREHYAAGRLSEAELDERVQAAYEAKTEEQLHAVRSDLPSLPATPQQRKAELVERRRHLQRRMLQESGGGIGLFVLCTGIWAVSGAHGQFWPVWVLLVTVVALVRSGWALYGPAPDLDRVEADLDRRASHNRGRGRGRGGPRSRRQLR